MDDKYIDNNLHIFFQFNIDGKRERNSMFEQGILSLEPVDVISKLEFY